MASVSELVEKLKNIGIRNGGLVDERAVDEIAEALLGGLGLDSVAHSEIRGIVLQLAEVKIRNSATAAEAEAKAEAATNSAMGGAWAGAETFSSNSSSTSSLGRGNSFSSRPVSNLTVNQGSIGSAGGTTHYHNHQSHPRRGRSPAPRANPSPSRRTFLAGLFNNKGHDEKKDDASVRSGRESPRLDPSAGQPSLPKRAPSPAPLTHLFQQAMQFPRAGNSSSASRASSPVPRPSHASHANGPSSGPVPMPRPSSPAPQRQQPRPTTTNSNPPRAHSPMPTRTAINSNPPRAHSPMPPTPSSRAAQPPVPCSPRPQLSVATSRPASPFCSRPGLQEDDADSMFSQSPSRRGGQNSSSSIGVNINNNGFHNAPHHDQQPPASQRRHLRSNSCNAQQMRRGAGDDDDESVQKPQPIRGHRKSSSDGIFGGAFAAADAAAEPSPPSASLPEGGVHVEPVPDPEPLHPAALNLPDFGSAPTRSSSSSVSASSVSSASLNHPRPHRLPVKPRSPAVGSMLTPPSRPLAFGSFDEGDDAVPVKTGAGKVRRKGGTPEMAGPQWDEPHPAAKHPHVQPYASDAGSTIQSSVSFDVSHPTLPPIRHSASFDVATGRPGPHHLPPNHHYHHQQATIPVNVAPATVNVPVPQFRLGASKRPEARRRHGFPRSSSDPVPAPVTIPPLRSPAEQAVSPMDVDTPFRTSTPATPFQIGTPPARGAGRVVPRGIRGQSRSTFDALSTGSVVSPPAVGPAKLPPPSSEELRRAEELKWREQIVALRNEASVLYSSADYRASIHKFTEAVSLVTSGPSLAKPGDKNDTLAVLLSNRAACFLMIGAYVAAIRDCERGLPYVSEGLSSVESLSTDTGPMLKVKLLTRLARALLKHGDIEGSAVGFNNALQEAQRVQTVVGILAPNHSDHIRTSLANSISEASLGQTDVSRIKDLLAKVSAFSRHLNGERLSSGEALGYVNMALKIANGSPQLLETKMSLLCGMKRWREAAGFCERLAASNAQFDGIFAVDPLVPLHPFPDASVPARFLSASFFDEARDESGSDLDLKLSANAVAEAVVRMPPALLPSYVRSLRLEERYPAADAAIRILEEVAGRNHRRDLHWLAGEKRKVSQTKSEREIGDEMYRVGDYDTAARQYASCLLIDSDGERNPNNETAGGRLHAVLHCNRAACFMASKHYHDAINECTAALKIHSRYMKAMLRRGRCYGRLHRYQDAITEFERYIELVEEARNVVTAPPVFVPPCLFDGPKEVTDADLQNVKTELESVRKSKRRSEANAKEEANLQRERYSAYHESFASRYSRAEPSASSSARQQQQSWHNRENESHRWDSYAGRRPNTAGSASHQRSKSFDSSPRGQNKKAPLGSPTLDPSSDHYAVLGLRRNASEDDIKKTYKKMALRYHPDKNRAEDAAEKFLRIQLAYETLSDPEKKRDYDLLNSYQRYQYY